MMVHVIKALTCQCFDQSTLCQLELACKLVRVMAGKGA